MGNCIETCGVITRLGSDEEGKDENQGKKIGEYKGNFVKNVVNSENNGLRVKMVLTKEELQWLMLLLNNRESEGKSIEDVLGEIEKARIKKVGVNLHAWKPSLDSITEIPEVLEMTR